MHHRDEIYRGRHFAFVTDALTILALQRTWFYLHGVSESRPPT